MNSSKISVGKPFLGVCIAAVLWTIMFSPWTAPHVNFWVMMTCSGATLTLFTCWARPEWWKDVRFDLSNIVIGIALAAALWGVFWLGEYLSTMMFDFARPQVLHAVGLDIACIVGHYHRTGIGAREREVEVLDRLGGEGEVAVVVGRAHHSRGGEGVAVLGVTQTRTRLKRLSSSSSSSSA